ncbi:GNAT family N-acetyltransferase [Bradyrhizobium roseum]|uniref:GNAT family N-acetyltransferase n=1 Tax=Bradyrhizobium roseum TaxID=3056648 RepID=UPI00387E918A
MLQLVLDAFAYMGPRIDPPSSALRLTPKSVQAHAESGTLLLAYRASDLVGCLFLHQKNDALYIGKFAVSPTLQHAGIGRKLMQAARDEARRRGIGTLELETRVELTENHAAFARMGFIKTAETSHQGFDRPTSIVMRAPV